MPKTARRLDAERADKATRRRLIDIKNQEADLRRARDQRTIARRRIDHLGKQLAKARTPGELQERDALRAKVEKLDARIETLDREVNA